MGVIEQEAQQVPAGLEFAGSLSGGASPAPIGCCNCYGAPLTL